MLLEYLGHACFKITQDSFSLIIDPYSSGSVPGLADLKEKANQVICSHDHYDHYGLSEVKLLNVRVDTPFALEVIDTYHDDKQGELRGKNNINIITHEDTRIVHMGDIGCMPEDEQIDKIKGCDVLLIPVGGFFTTAPDITWEIVKKVNPKVCIPMHFRSETFGYDVIGTVDEFLKYADIPAERIGSSLNIDDLGAERRLIVMTPSKA
ncbi:MAG: MBL fold metallo-hydrolase [Saccharofermentans sp.]|nr:MBL fold metallo-hydrolase [Saccharofermentans sp.]